MAIAFNAATTGGGVAGSDVTGLNTTFTNISGADRIAIVLLYTQGSVSSVSVTMGGQSMGAPVFTLADNSIRVYTLTNCPVNSASLVSSWTGNSPGCIMTGVVYTGVEQTGPLRDSKVNTGGQEGVSSTTLTMTSALNDMIVDAVLAVWGDTTSGVGQTRRITLNNPSDLFRSAGMSEKAASAGTTNMSWTMSDTSDIYQIGFTLIPAADGGPVTGTVNPTRGQLTINGRTPAINPFTNVRISEILINEAGSPVASRTGLHLLVYYEGFPLGAPDLSYSNASTGSAGTLSYSLASGPLVYNQPIFYVLHDGNASGSLSAYTCGRMVPTYT